MIGEIIKLLFSGLFTVLEIDDRWGARFLRLSTLILNSHRVFVLSLLYMIGNLLAYYALARVEASTYTVFMQLKVIVVSSDVIYLSYL